MAASGNEIGGSGRADGGTAGRAGGAGGRGIRIVLTAACLLVACALVACGGGGAGEPDVPSSDVATDPGTPPDPGVDPGCEDPGGDDPGAPDDVPGDAGTDPAGGDPGIEVVDWRLPAVASCAPDGSDPCRAEPAPADPVASFRKDFFLPYEDYPEDRIADPTTGGRVQVPGIAAVGGAVTRVEIAGHDVTVMALPAPAGDTPAEVTALVAERTFDWVHVWPYRLEPGRPFFVTFHAGAAWIDQATELPVRVTTDQGVAYQATARVVPTRLPLTWVTTSDDGRTLRIHVRNDSDQARTLASLAVQGADVTASSCVADRVLAPGAAAMWSVPLCTPLRIGDAWTVVASWDDGDRSIGVGRAILSHFPIHAWVNGDDCPFPGGRWDYFLAHREAGFDMPFLRGRYDGDGCNGVTARQVVSRSAHIPDAYYLLDEWADADGLDTTRLARLLGDEVDSGYGDKPWRVSRDAKASWQKAPALTTYIGGARHRRTATFAGIADIQGFDIYFAACAPSILDGEIPSLRAPFDYCRTVRANQMPGPHWFYSQGISGWGYDPGRDPDAAELKVAAMSVAACGSKGLMYFMTQMERNDLVPDTWQAMHEVNRDIRAVRAFLREGDATGGARTDEPDVLLDAIRAPRAIVVPVVDAKAAQVVDWPRCILEADPHWVLAEVETDVVVTVPDDFAVAELLEVVDGDVVPAGGDAFAIGRDVTIPRVTLGPDRPYRLFVLAADDGVADAMRAAMVVPDAGPEPAEPALAATATCAPTLAACDAPAHDPGILASYRKDFFYPYQTYPEASIPDPVDGGRVQVTAIAAASGRVTGIAIAGRDVSDLLADWPGDEPPQVTAFTDDDWMHWIHVWPRVAEAGRPIWVAFHSGHPWLDQADFFAIRVSAGDDVVLDGQFAPARPVVPITYVTPVDDYAALMVHVRNEDAVPRTLARLVVDGRDVTGAACIPKRTLAPGEPASWRVPLCAPTRPGAPWTVTAQWQDAPASTAGGRVVVPHFGIHTWPSSTDCPFPGANEDNFRNHLAHGFDTPFLWKSTYANYEGCNGADAQSILSLYDAMPDLWLMVSKETPLDGHDTSRIIRFTGDEPDSEVGTAPWNKARHSINLWDDTPETPTYVGGSRHRHNGAFAGVTDIQGFDIYISACAPYIMDYGNFPPLRSPYDYAHAVRRNHMPWPTWIYSHGMLGKKDPVREPAPSELWVQAMSPILAGAKGLMYFQTNMGGARRRPASWEAIGQANRMIRGVRAFLVEGDPTGLAQAGRDDVLAEAIRARDAIVVPVVDVSAHRAMDDFRCLLEEDPHWELAPVGTYVRVRIPDDFTPVEILEVIDGTVRAPAGEPYAIGRDLVIPSIVLDDARPVRLYVLAADASVAQRIRDAMVLPEWTPPGS